MRIHYTYNGNDVVFKGNNSLLSFSAFQASDVTENNNTVSVRTQIPYSEWDQSIPDVNIERIQQVIGAPDEYICIETNSLEVQGNVFAETFKYFHVAIHKWLNSSDSQIVWEDQSVIDQVVNTVKIRISVINTYYDLNNFEKPINSYLDDNFEYSGITGLTSRISFSITYNEAETQDSYLSLFLDHEEDNFISVENAEYFLQSAQDSMIMDIAFLK